MSDQPQPLPAQTAAPVAQPMPIQAPAPVAQPMRYLDKAMGALRDLGLALPTAEGGAQDSPITALLGRITELDQGSVAVISRTLNQASPSTRWCATRSPPCRSASATGRSPMPSTRSATTPSDGRPDGGRQALHLERLSNIWMKVTRGDIADRFDKIRATYLEVARDTKDQIEREHRILDAYARLPRRAEAGAGASPRGAEDRAGRQARRGQGGAAAANTAVEQFAGGASRRSGPGWNWRATSACARCRTRRGATRSPRTSPTT